MNTLIFAILYCCGANALLRRFKTKGISRMEGYSFTICVTTCALSCAGVCNAEFGEA